MAQARIAQCRSCGSENLSDSIYCDECGQSLETICLECGAGNRPLAKYCRKCGRPMTARQ
jgi:ribosomal protein L40E